MNNHRTRFVQTFQNVEEQVSSPFNTQIREFCESDLFPEIIQNSEVTSSSSCCYDDQSSYTTSLSFLPDITQCSTLVENATNTTVSAPANTTALTENAIFTSLDLSNTFHYTNHQYRSSNQDQFDISMLQVNQLSLRKNNTTLNDPVFSYPYALSSDLVNDHAVPITGPTSLPTFCEEDDTCSIPPKSMQLSYPSSPNYYFVDSNKYSYFPRSTGGFGTFDENLFLENDIQTRDIEFQGDDIDGIFCTDPLRHSYKLDEVLSVESQYLVNGGGSCATQLTSEVRSLDSETFRFTNELTNEDRKEKIDKYMKKRNQRNFTKKIKYACRKALADSRRRIRGRFAKNDEFGKNIATNNHEEDNDEDVIRSFHDNQVCCCGSPKCGGVISP